MGVGMCDNILIWAFLPFSWLLNMWPFVSPSPSFIDFLTHITFLIWVSLLFLLWLFVVHLFHMCLVRWVAIILQAVLYLGRPSLSSIIIPIRDQCTFGEVIFYRYVWSFLQFSAVT